MADCHNAKRSTGRCFFLKGWNPNMCKFLFSSSNPFSDICYAYDGLVSTILPSGFYTGRLSFFTEPAIFSGNHLRLRKGIRGILS